VIIRAGHLKMLKAFAADWPPPYFNEMGYGGLPETLTHRVVLAFLQCYLKKHVAKVG
jgi:hypothetical protein